MMIKDISRFKKRDIKRSILFDPKPLNFILTPENGLPCVGYSAELDIKEDYLLTIIDEIKYLAELEDTRPYLE